MQLLDPYKKFFDGFWRQTYKLKCVWKKFWKSLKDWKFLRRKNLTIWSVKIYSNEEKTWEKVTDTFQLKA